MTGKYVIGAWPRYGVTNPRNTIMYDFLVEEGNEVLDLKSGLKNFFLSDVLHFHWPEKAFSSSIPLAGAGFSMFIGLLKVFRKKVIWTVHNDYREEKLSRLGQFFFLKFVSLVDLFLLPSQSSYSVVQSAKRGKNFKWALLPLGIYPKKSEEKSGDYNLIVGRLTKKKDVVRTVRDFCMKFPSHKFLIAGEPESDNYKRELLEAIQGVENITFEFRFLSEDKIHELVASSRAVVIDYAEGKNSGVATLAATYNKPIYMRSTIMNRDLARMYGIECTPISQFPEVRMYDSSNRSIKSIGERYVKILRRRL